MVIYGGFSIELGITILMVWDEFGRTVGIERTGLCFVNCLMGRFEYDAERKSYCGDRS